MIKILSYLNKKQRFYCLLTILSVLLTVWLNLKMPDYMSAITTLVETPHSKMSNILVQGGWMLLCAVGAGAGMICSNTFGALVSAGLAQTLRRKVYYHTTHFAMEDIDHFSTDSLINRTTNDITQIQNFIGMGMSFMFMSPIMAIWAICKIAGKSWQWSAATGAALLILVIVLSVGLAIAIPHFKKVQSLTDQLNLVTREQLTGIRVVRAYNAEQYQTNKFARANDNLTNNNLTAFHVMSLFNPTVQTINSFLPLVVYLIGASMIAAAKASSKLVIFSDMIVFSSYAMQIIMSFMILSMVIYLWPRASVSSKRVNEILDRQNSMTDGPGTSASTQGSIEFKNVSFKYPNAHANVLKDISFKVTPGSTFAIIGGTGSGKTTLLNLIVRFFDTTSGEVLVDGYNVKNYTFSQLHNKIGYASQNATLFKGTVKSNVVFGHQNEISDQAVNDSLNLAQATEFVTKMPEKTEAAIAQGGHNVSGGQKQRLSIARALARKPEILLFDDSFSALDYKTDRQLRHTLNQELASSTKIIVAQRISTIRDADQILVLDHGQAVGIGKHEDLLKTCPSYREIAESQLSKEELA